MGREQEFIYLLAYAREADLNRPTEREILRCIWTTYCYHRELTVDGITDHDEDLLRVWGAIDKNVDAIAGDSDWSCYETFSAYMYEYWPYS